MTSLNRLVKGAVTFVRESVEDVVDLMAGIYIRAKFNKMKVAIATVTPTAIYAGCGPGDCVVTNDCGDPDYVCSSSNKCVDAIAYPEEACGDSPLKGQVLTNVYECGGNRYFRDHDCFYFYVDGDSNTSYRDPPSVRELESDTDDNHLFRVYGFLSDNKYVFHPGGQVPDVVDNRSGFRDCLDSIVQHFGGFTTSHGTYTDSDMQDVFVPSPSGEILNRHQCGEWINDFCGLDR